MRAPFRTAARASLAGAAFASRRAAERAIAWAGAGPPVRG